MLSVNRQVEPASTRLMRHKNHILLTWEKEIRNRIPQANNQSHPILINTLPKFLDNLSEALSESHSRKLATDGSTIAQEHGGERARVTNYTLDCIFTEYYALRETIFNVLLSDGPLTDQERYVIRSSIDEATKESALAFTLVLEGIRQQFIATLTHDLRGPLTAASASMEMILRYPEKKDRHPHLAVRALDNLKRTDKMISDLLDATRVQAGEVLSFEMSECEAVSMIRTACHELATIYGDRFLFTSPVDSVMVCWNSEAIYRVIENLASNAVKYGYPNTPITIKLTNTDGRVVLLVHNDGAPIDPEEQETLFQAFKRSASAVKGKQKGWGLGLALVRGVAEGHGGSIIVESTQDRGNTFGIDILQDARQFKDFRR